MARTRSSNLAMRSAGPPERLRSLRSPAQRFLRSSAVPTRQTRQTRQTQSGKAGNVKCEAPSSSEEDESDEDQGEEENEENEEEEEEEKMKVKVKKSQIPVGLTEYERKRRANIERNLAFMQSMGVSTAKMEARTAVGKSVTKPVSGETKAMREKLRQERIRQGPVRKSRRLEGKTVELKAEEDPEASFETRQRKAHTKAPTWSSVLDTGSTDSKAFLASINAQSDEEEEELESEEPDREDNRVAYSLAGDDVVKAVQERIYSVAFLPRSDRIVVACGDKIGHLALWSPVRGPSNELLKPEADAATTVALYRPHSNPLCQLIFAREDSSKLVSASYDGAVREFDLRAAESSQVFTTDGDADIMSMSEAGTGPKCYYVSCTDGTVRLVDRRVDKKTSTSYELHEKKINTVSQHPSQDFCFATASLDRTVCLWDARRLHRTKNTALVTLPHSRSVNCAYFSPRDGEWLVTVGQDSYIDMFDTRNLSQVKRESTLTVTIPKPMRVRHDNITGRWLTKLHAAWDPKRLDQFVMGCMEHPRRLQIFRAGRRRPIHELRSEHFASVHSINAFHPHLDLIAGGNSSGRMCLWRGKKTEPSKAEVKSETIKAEVKSEV